ncbi:V8-like Glu-specific endopeptidase [Nonomuraea maritima]|uniref:V8-like Glu-specific endopeptidase n=1 Tax=Nonomuraea maritima TaxID=683260 RepID=A0A1G8TFT7_9ACTN|nr:trypsin-like serine protease [Nonomuraea maritima]SDJ40452.1 V8-like Glu-specific endopeptidase [Nonomuraea maritima]
MTLSTPLLAAVPLLAGFIGPALVGAAPGPQQTERPAVAAVSAPTRHHTAARHEVVEHVAARTAGDQRRVLDYWTPERMAKAVPVDLLDLLAGERGLFGGLTGRPVGVLHGLSGRDAGGPVPTRQRAADRGAPARPDATTAGSRWMTGGLVARTTGRVFLTVGGTDFVCSASTIKGASRDVVVTAGHCVKDGAGEWAANWTFVPGYGSADTQPYGRYTARRMFVAGPWSRGGDDDYDVGMVVLNTSRGRHVADVVGAQEIAFNAPRGGQVFGFGYPADPPYDGSRLVYCAGRVKGDPHGQTRDQGLGCTMTAGSSGGPWMTRFDPATGRGVITSLSSFKYSDDRRTMYGPYFGDAVKALYHTAQRA